MNELTIAKREDLAFRIGRAVAHSMRFRLVSTRYPRRVTEAYMGDLARAAADSDEQVAGIVAAWEQAHGLEPVDWVAIGVEERDELDLLSARELAS